MLRISGNVVPENKRVEIALTYVYGIGRTRAMEVRQKMEIESSVRIKDLTNEQIVKMRDIIDSSYKIIGGDLAASVRANVKRLMDIGCYRGYRHMKALPCRGQRTRSNSRTRTRCKVA
jgi:small subunit ribosomal protein S13